MAIKLQGTNSAAAPGLTNDGGDGVVVGTDSVDISTGGTSRVKVDSSGNVGIGTTTPQAKLEIKGTNDGGNFTALHLRNAGGNGSDVTINMISSTDQTNTAARSFIKSERTGSGSELTFGTGNTERLRVLAGGGLTFNGDTAAANALDDYEEGSFTPTWDGVTNTTDKSVWRYTKIGDQCRIWGRFTCDTTTNTTTEIEVGNLPYTSKDNFNNSWSEAISAVMVHNVEQANNATFAYLYWNRSAFKFFQTQQSGAWDALRSSDIAVGDHMVVDLTYTVV